MSIRCFALSSNRRTVLSDASLSSRACRAKTSTLTTALTLALLIVQFGCASSKKVQLPEVVGDNPKSAELIRAVNDNAAKIKSIYAPSASVGFSNLPNYASCQLVFESPNRFRLRGSVSLVGQVVDCGCNGEDFWFWGRYQNPDELYYCKLNEYTGGALSTYMPVDPSWFPEALGVDEIKESDILDEPQQQEDGTLLVTLKKARADGAYRKRLYFEPRTAAVSRQDVQDPNGNVVVSVVCREQQYVESPGVVLPKRLEITCTETGETLIVDLGTVTLNEANTISSTAFTRPTDLKVREVDVGAALKKKDALSLTKPAEIAPVARQAETTQGIENTRAVETSVVTPIAPPVEKQTDDSGATWTTVSPSQFDRSSTQRAIAPEVVATPAASPNVATNFSQANAATIDSASSQAVVQTSGAPKRPFVLEGSGAPIDASTAARPAVQANSNSNGGVMIAGPSSAPSTDSGVTPFPTNLTQTDSRAIAQTPSTQASAANVYSTSTPLVTETLRPSTPYVEQSTQAFSNQSASNSIANDAQAVYVADASAQSNVPTGTSPGVAPSYEEPAPIDDVLLDEEFPAFSN